MCFKEQIKTNYESHFLINTILMNKNKENKIKKLKNLEKIAPTCNKIIFIFAKPSINLIPGFCWDSDSYFENKLK